MDWLLFELCQHPFFAPNVSGWPSGSTWLHAGTLVTWSKVSFWLTCLDNGKADSAIVSPTIRRLKAEATGATGGALALKLAGLYDVSPQTTQAVRDYAAAGPWDHWRAAGTLALALQSPEFYVN
jgi:hypothetical protein